MQTLFLLIGIATTYAGPYVGQPLYCDTGGTLLYTLPSRSSSLSLWERAGVREKGAVGEGLSPWVALDVRLYQTGQARCGDHVVILFPPLAGRQEGGAVLHALALDAGPFEGYYVRMYPSAADHRDLPIVADIPAHLAPFSGLSSPVHVLNLSALDRAMEAADVHLLP